jgi:hypothetical protein
VACQRQHWNSHKRQCPDLAQDELISITGRFTHADLDRIFNDPDPSELLLFPKLTALAWTLRSRDAYRLVNCLQRRATWLLEGRPVPGDTKAILAILLKRAALKLPWPELPGGTQKMFDIHLEILAYLAQMGEPEAAVEICSHHMEEVERHVKAPNNVAKYHFYRLEWLLLAAGKEKEGEEKMGAYVAEAKGLMERATRSLRGLRKQDWDFQVG